jgi:hypothetical protein
MGPSLHTTNAQSQVHLPPKDQQHVDRLGLLYFARPQNDLKLNTIDSPVLKSEGYTQNEFELGRHHVPTMGGVCSNYTSSKEYVTREYSLTTLAEFTKLKQTWQQQKRTGYEPDEGREILPGFKGEYHK